MSLHSPTSAVRPSAGRRRWIVALIAAALVAQPIAPAPFRVAAYAQTLPDLGDESQALYSPAQERKLGESVVRQIRSQGAYLDDPEVNDYLNQIGQRLVVAVPDTKQDFEFFAVADPSINAFALPGGYRRRQYRIDPAHPDRIRARVRAGARNQPRHAASLHPLDGGTEALAPLCDRRARGGDRRVTHGRHRRPARRPMPPSRPRRPSRCRASSTTRAKTNTRPTGSASSVSTPRASTTTEWRASCSASRSSRGSRNRTSPSYLRTHPITYERIAEAQARAQGKPYRQVARFARLPSRARAPQKLHRHAARGGRCTSTNR